MNRRRMLPAAYCLIAAAALLMVCSMNSWLYPINPWVDVNIISTVGRAMFDGMVPYRDLVEQKGPLLFALFGLGMKLTPGSYHGLYLLEVLAVAGAMYFGWKTLRLYLPKLSPAWLPLLLVTLMACNVFQMGGSAEEFLLLPVAWSMYDLLKAWRSGERMKPGTLIRNGLFAGCILWVKFNLLSVHFVWMAALALDAVAKDRRIGRALKMCLWFLAGMALASVPWLIYFGANGAIRDLVQNYFLDNLTSYGARMYSVPKTIALGIYVLGLRGPVYFGVLVLAGLSVALVPRRIMALREKLTLIAMAVLLTASMYSRIAANVYYGVMFAVFLPFALLPLRALERVRRPERLEGTAVRMVTAGGALALSVICALLTSDFAHYIGTDYKTLPQAKVAEQVSEGETLLSYMTMDGGYYMAADVRPCNRWFTLLNVLQEDCYEEQSGLVAQGVPDWLVTGWIEDEVPGRRDMKLEHYELAGVYETNYAFGGSSYCYLFRRANGEGEGS